MDELITVVNKLQDTFAAAGIANPIDLPQIVVIGSQSSGKSSVLENIVRRDFLPRGSGIVTRRPLVLQLIHTPATEPATESATSKQQPVEWAEFLHRPGERFSDFSRVREEIVADTDAKTGGTKGISPIPINLRIFSPHVLNLTLVDLPGMTKVPLGDQPKDIEKQIRDMILKFIAKPNAIILAVTAANVDLANSDGLKLAREVDPDGVRTIGVLTKIDLIDSGTEKDILDILAGRVIFLRHGYIPVVNRGQKDIDRSKSVSAALDDERKFFHEHPIYASKAAYCGTPYLASKLNEVLLAHIKACLPDIKGKISSNLAKYREELTALGGGPQEAQANCQTQLLAIITEFCNDYRSTLDGGSFELSSSELNGGARISFIFHEIFSGSISAMDPFDQIKDNDIRTLLYNASGSCPALFVATSSFEILIKQQIKRLEDPSVKCISMVQEELTKIMSQLLSSKLIFKRFPHLRDRFFSAVSCFLRNRIDPTTRLVTSIVAAEGCYINVCHPEFVGGHRAFTIVNEKLYGPPKSTTPAKPTNPASAPASETNSTQKSGVAIPALSVQSDTADGFFSSFFGSKKGSKKGGVLEAMPAVLKATGQVSERELIDIEVIKTLLQSYYAIVKRTITDLVPKAIMLQLVSYSKEELHAALLQELYKPASIPELLKETESTMERRRECSKMIDALTKAEEIVSSLQ